ncbi:MAG: alpha/beta hydrolase [Betaproteobacteria bacterium]
MRHVAVTAGFARAGSAAQPVRIFYRLFGEPGALPVLIVHGLSFFSFDWAGPATRLATFGQVAAMDMRGFGDSDWPGDYSLAAHAADIIAVLDHLGWQRAALIGHSMGGRHAAVAAADYPERFACLVLVDYTPENAPVGSARVAKRLASTPDAFESVDAALRWSGVDPESADGRLKRPRFEAYLKPAPGGGLMFKRDPHFRDQFRRQLETGERHKLELDMWQVLQQIACPTLILRGARSDMFAADTVPRVLAANAHFRLAEADAGHNVAGDDPDGFQRAVQAFLHRDASSPR